MLTLNIFFPEDKSGFGINFDDDPDSATNSSGGTLDRYTPPLNEEQQVLYHKMGGNGRAMLCNMIFCLFGNGEEQKEEINYLTSLSISKTIAYYRKLGFQIQEDQYIATALLLDALPFGADSLLVEELMRYRSMEESQLAKLLPMACTLTERNSEVSNVKRT